MSDKKELSNVIDSLTAAISELNKILADDECGEENDRFEFNDSEEDVIDIIDDEESDKKEDEASDEEEIDIEDDEKSEEKEEPVEEGLLSSIGNAVKGAVKGIFGEDVDEEDDELFECDMTESDNCDESILNPLEPIQKAATSVVGKIFGEECEDGECSDCDESCECDEEILNESIIADMEDKFDFRITSRLSQMLFYGNAYVLVEPSEVAYSQGCRVIYVNDEQMICIYDEATDEYLYEHFVDNDIDVESQLRHIFQSELGLHIDEIGDVRVIKKAYYR